jgi:hypothetical protein
MPVANYSASDMNIFYLDHDVRKCAEMHVDRHCVKMILEYAQLLSTAHRILDGVLSFGVSASGRKRVIYVLADNRDSILYSATHINHPSAVWVRQSDKNYDWLFALFQALMDEYTHRYGKVHACSKLEMYLARIPENIPQKPFTEPTPAMPDDVKVLNDSVASYRNYYIHNKTHLANWKKRPVPDWYNDNTA